MIPIVVDAGQLKVAVVGEGLRALGRLTMLSRHGAEPQAVFAPEPCPELAAASGERLVRRWPDSSDFANLDLVFGGDLTRERAEALAHAARQAKALFNAEDITPLCAFHVPATVRRGPLLMTVSTDGTAPSLSRQIAAHLSGRFGPEWEAHVREVGDARKIWRAEGLDGAAIARKTEALIAEKGWLA